VPTFVPIHDRDEQTLLRELTHRVRNELASSISVVSAAAVRTENPEVKGCTEQYRRIAAAARGRSPPFDDPGSRRTG
jgi:two-component sensor histidine kinase